MENKQLNLSEVEAMLLLSSLMQMSKAEPTLDEAFQKVMNGKELDVAIKMLEITKGLVENKEGLNDTKVIIDLTNKLTNIVLS